MKYSIRKNSAAKHGYDFVITHEDGHEEIKAITAKTSDGYLKLPENPMWKMARISLLEATQGDLILTESRPKKQPGETTHKPSAKWLDYVSEADKKILEEIKARAEAAMKKATLQEQIKALQEQLKSLKGAE